MADEVIETKEKAFVKKTWLIVFPGGDWTIRYEIFIFGILQKHMSNAIAHGSGLATSGTEVKKTLLLTEEY